MRFVMQLARNIPNARAYFGTSTGIKPVSLPQT
jgi:hypothetical protein